jgi:hypothetical protein
LKTRSKRVAALALIGLLLVASCGRTPSGVSPGQATSDRRASAAGSSSAAAVAFSASPVGPGAPDVILVPEGEPWLLAIASPLAGRLRRGDEVPYLLAVSTPPGREVQALLSRLAPRRSLVLTPAANPDLIAALPGPSPEVFLTGADPLAASLLVAKRFWGTCGMAVVAPREDPAALILGSALAARLSVPLLIGPALDAEDMLAAGLDGLRVAQVLLAGSDSAGQPAWAGGLKQQVVVLAHEELPQRLIAALGAAKVRTVVVARVPDEVEGVGATAWLAPYVSLARGGPVVLCRSPTADETEARVARLIGQQEIRPRSVTIVADYCSIGTNTVTVGEARCATASSEVVQQGLQASSGTPAAKQADDEGNPPYEVETEPCVPTRFGQVAGMSVGRIPFGSLEAAAVLFARGLLRPRLVAGQRPPRMLMVANPNLDEPLPLCEVVGRVTADEFKNCRVRVDEFYRRPAGSPEVMAALGAAHLIMYQGHGYHDWLFRSPADAPRQRSNHRNQRVGREVHDSQTAQKPLQSKGAAEPSPPRPQEKAPQQHRAPSFHHPLEGLPVVVLQACHSLHEDVLQQIQQLGGVALVGTSTPIHSGSGTAFAKAFSDGLLYRGDTLGEAFRDAQNYLFCLQDLGDHRGHQEQAKMQRVALSFRLWGDPELRVFPQPLAKPTRRPVSITWDAPDRLKIKLPETRLAEQRAAAYVARLFPGSETGAMVRRAGSGEARLLTPVHFFRLPLPKNFLAAGYAALRRREDGSFRAVFRVDPAGRFLYVLYFPNKESPKKTFTLQFLSPRPVGGAAGGGVPHFAGLLADGWTGGAFSRNPFGPRHGESFSGARGSPF